MCVTLRGCLPPLIVQSRGRVQVIRRANRQVGGVVRHAVQTGGHRRRNPGGEPATVRQGRKKQFKPTSSRWPARLPFRNGRAPTSTVSSSCPWRTSSSRPTSRSTPWRKTLPPSPLWSRQVAFARGSSVRVSSLIVFPPLPWTVLTWRYVPLDFYDSFMW